MLSCCSSRPRVRISMGRLARVQDDINEATDIMRENIEQVVGRGEHLELLVDKSDSFSANARAFQKESKGLKNALWWKNFKMICMLMMLVLGLGLLGAMGMCGGPTFSKCRKLTV
jgi:vesicle-associated membrane protein 7